jgi:hypothetical protein
VLSAQTLRDLVRMWGVTRQLQDVIKHRRCGCTSCRPPFGSTVMTETYEQEATLAFSVGDVTITTKHYHIGVRRSPAAPRHVPSLPNFALGEDGSEHVIPRQLSVEVV